MLLTLSCAGGAAALQSGMLLGCVTARLVQEGSCSNQSGRKAFPGGLFRTGADKDPEGDFTRLSIDHRQPRETRPNTDVQAASQGYVIQMLLLRRRAFFFHLYCPLKTDLDSSAFFRTFPGFCIFFSLPIFCLSTDNYSYLIKLYKNYSPQNCNSTVKNVMSVMTVGLLPSCHCPF